MAYTELHTAALRLVHVTRPTEHDMDYLTREFHLTPPDVEALLGVNSDSAITSQETYRRLTVQWPTPTRRGIVISDVHCLVAYSWVIIVDHGDFPAASDLIEELQSVPSERLWQDGAMMIVYELWRRAIRGLQQYDHALSPAHLLNLTRVRSQLGTVLKEFATSSPQPLDQEIMKGFSFLAFMVNHFNPAGARTPIATPTKLPFTARSYAAASAAVVILTLIVVSRTL